MPNSDNDLRSPRDAECARVIARCRSNAEFGPLDDKGAELPGNCPVWSTDDAVSVKAVPVAYCKLEYTESCERLLEVLPLGDSISHSQNFRSTTNRHTTTKDTKIHRNKLS